MMNTRALHVVGLWEPQSTAPPGAVVHRDGSGLPTGIATELYYLLPPYSTEDVKTALRAHARAMFVEKGTTSISTVPYASGDIRADLELQAEGALPLRIRMYYHVPQMISLDSLLDMGFVSGVGSDMFRFGGMKLFVDGAGHNGMGQPLEDFKWTQEELDDLVYRAHAAGIQVLMHVITDAAFERAATAIQRALGRDGRAHRHRLEHGGSVEGIETMRRLRKLGLLLTVTPSEGRSGRATPRYRTLLREGFELIAITDTTGTVPGSSDPLRKIAYAVATAGEGGGAPRGEEITFDEALRMFTIWAARGSLEEQDKGSITPGKLGDFAVLSADPRGRPAEELFDLRVDATILGGDLVYER
jgi:predicted amidohydrolase YtcJ